MELELIELTAKNEVCKTYDIYKHCMFMPTEEKFNKQIDQFLNDNSVKIFACFNQDKIEGVIAISFIISIFIISELLPLFRKLNINALGSIILPFHS